MAGEEAEMDWALGAFGRAPFALADLMRRSRGDRVAALGLGPSECPYRVIGSGPHWRLRDYGAPDGAPALLVVAAPIKRPYIWDLAPSASAIRRCLRQGLRVYLLEWLPASRDDAHIGLDETVRAIADGVARVAADGARPFLIGHSLGGTLAAIHAAYTPDSLAGLVLLGAPLCFAPHTSRFRDALVSLAPPMLSETEPFPGSLLSHMSALASPHTFVWERMMDAALSLGDGRALEIHARIERWALDEVALPGKLVRQIIEELYRDDRFLRGTLAVRGAVLGPARIAVPTLAVVNTADDVAPPSAIEPFVAAMPAGRVMRYPGEVGVGLQHLGILVGRKAQAEIWPRIIAWMRSPDEVEAQ